MTTAMPKNEKNKDASTPFCTGCVSIFISLEVRGLLK
jgi:hypothetical protein